MAPDANPVTMEPMGSLIIDPPAGEPSVPTPAEEVNSRVAWLLRVNRESHDAAPLEAFAAKIGRRGVRADPVTIAAWESAALHVGVEVIEAYEAALEVPPGRFTRSAQLTTRVLAGTALRPPRVLPSPEVRRELDRLAEVVRHGHPTGQDWLSLAQLLTQPDGVVLPGFLEDHWLYLLIDELARSVGPSYLTRSEALARIMDDELHAGRLVALVRERVHEAGAQASADALAVWGTGRDTASVDAAIALLRDPDATIRRGANAALLRRASSGRLTAAHRDRIGATLRDLAASAPEAFAPESRVLAARVSPALCADLPEDARPDSEPAVSHILGEIARAAGVDLADDPILEQVLREAFDDAKPERRPQAVFMLASSPYGSVVAQVTGTLLRQQGDIARRAGRAAVNLAQLIDRDCLLDVLDADDPALRSYALIALSHGDGVPADVDLQPYLEDPDTAYAAVYAAGMSRHPVLETASRQPGLSPESRRAVQWWIDRGGRVRDEDPS